MYRAAKFSTDRFAFKLGLFYAAYFFFGGIQLPFFPLWLEARGLDPQTIGLIIAVPMMVRIVATPAIAHQADRHRALKAALVIASAGGTLAMTIVGLLSAPFAILAVYVIAAVAFSPVLSLADAYALSGLPQRGRAYGPVRLWGSAAFIAGNVGAGLLLEWFAPGFLIWLIVAALALSVLAAIALDPIVPVPSAVPDGTVKASPLSLLRNPAFIAIALASAMIQSSHSLFYGFSAVQWRAAGFDGLTIGGLWGLGVGTTIALFALSGRLPAAFKPSTLIVIGGLGAALRWVAMMFDPGPWLIAPLQILHAASFGATHLGLMAFMARAVPRELAATGQGLVATMSGVVNASATLVSGFVYAALGAQAYGLMAAMAVVGVVSAAYAGRRPGG
jgi:MFS transporter, PPP family, 3-phenylpropionic acid transporter